MVLTLMSMTAMPAFAQVHGVSEAGCGKSGNSGATQSSGNTPGVPIPLNAGGQPGGGGAEPNGVNCPCPD